MLTGIFSSQFSSVGYRQRNFTLALSLVILPINRCNLLFLNFCYVATSFTTVAIEVILLFKHFIHATAMVKFKMYGSKHLSIQMKYCKICSQTDTRPNVIFNDDGICAACKIQEQRKKIDWTQRERELKQIAKWAKDNSSSYDCVVGVSGGKDSTFQSVYARDVLGLKPLLVNAAPDNITPWGRANLENLVQMGFDLISIRPNPIINKITIKTAFYKYGNPLKPTEYYLWASAFRVAINYKIPLVIQGENGAEVFGLRGVVPNGDALQTFNFNTVKEDVSIWESEKVNKKDLFFWTPPTSDEIIKSGIKAIFLGYYAKEWSESGNTKFSVNLGLKGRENHSPDKVGYISKYIQIDTNFLPVNNLLKYYKFGFGGVTDEISIVMREEKITPEEVSIILNGERLTRENAIKLIGKYDGKCSDSYIKNFCDYIGITIDEFWNHVDNHIVNKKLFKKDKTSGKWVPRFEVGADFIE